MPPTVGDSSRKEAARREHKERKEGFVCVIKYTNFLPDIPFDAKFVGFPFETNRFIQYKPTSLERNYKNDLLTEPDLGVTIDLINPETYDIDLSAELHEDDEKLLEEEQAPQADQKRHRQHAKTVSWLRKTEYISTEYNRFQTSNEMVETKVGHGTKNKLRGTENLDLYKDRDSQLQSIESSFEAAKKPITRHHTNSRLHPVEILPVFPDFHFWHMPCAHVIFDTEPTPRGKTSAASKEEMSLGMIRGMEDESGDQFVAYFLPSSDTLDKRQKQANQPTDNPAEQPDQSEEFDYKLAREYNWNVQNKAIKGFEENYFFVLREREGVFYNELQTRVRLNKRRGVGGTGKISSSVSKLIVKTREPTENEIRLQTMRLMQLENVAQEEDDEEDDDDEGDNSGGEQASAEEGVAEESGGEKAESDEEKEVEVEEEEEREEEEEEEERAEESPQAEDNEEQNDETNKTEEQSNHSESDIFGSSSSEDDD